MPMGLGITKTRKERQVSCYDNEGGKGDHRHIDEKASVYTFKTPETLIADFQTGYCGVEP